MRWWGRLLRRHRVETQLDAELRDHVERQVTDFVAAGLSEAEARRRANLDFGGLAQVKELCRDARGTRWLEDLAQDVQFGARVFRKNPTFTLAAVLSLALGIGASTAIFTLVDATMLKALPVREPSSLVELLNKTSANPPGNAFSYQALVYLREHARTVDIIASHESDFLAGADGSPSELRKGQYRSPETFSRCLASRRPTGAPSSQPTINPVRRQPQYQLRALAAPVWWRPISDRSNGQA